MNLLFVGTIPPHPGGSAIMNGRMLAGLARQGITCRALAPMTAETAARGDDFAAGDHGVEIHRYQVPEFALDFRRFFAPEYQDAEGPAIKAGMDALIAEQRPDVIIAGRESFVWHVASNVQGSGIPSVLICHTRAEVGAFNPVLLASGRHEQFLKKLRRFDLVVTVAKNQVEGWRELGLPNLAVVPNGVDTDFFAPRPRNGELASRLGIEEDRVVIMHASNLKPFKRALDLVQAAPAVIERQPKAMFLVVGDGPCREEVQQECARRGLEGRFRFPGWASQHEMVELFNLADVVVMPSESEAMPLVYLETMACGRLLLASDIPAAREVLRDGDTGLFFRKGDVHDLTAKLVRAATDKSLRLATGRRARIVAQEWSIGESVRRYTAVLRELVRKHREGRRTDTDRALSPGRDA